MPRIITCPGCGQNRPHRSKGLCNTCYQRAQDRYRRQVTPTCQACGFPRPLVAKGLCNACYKQHRRAATRDMTWQPQALCFTTPGWNPSRERHTPGLPIEAKQAICQQCPVRSTCLTYRLHDQDADDVYGGQLIHHDSSNTHHKETQAA